MIFQETGDFFENFQIALPIYLRKLIISRKVAMTGSKLPRLDRIGKPVGMRELPPAWEARK